MSGLLRAAITETRNAFAAMPARTEELDALAPRLEEVRAANVAHNLELVSVAAAAGARAVCLGELFTGPYFALERRELWRGLAEDAAEGPTVSAVRAAAARLGVVVVAPIYEFEAASGRRFNTAVVVDADGALAGKYRKNHVPEGANERAGFHETFYYERGDDTLPAPARGSARDPRYPVFDTAVGRVGVSICYDRHFPRVAEALADEGAQLVFSPAVTFGAKSRRMWELEFEVDAARHRLFIGGGNRRGVEPPWTVEYFGGGHFVGPEGRVAPVDVHPELVVADLDLASLVRDDPSGWNLRRDRRH